MKKTIVALALTLAVSSIGLAQVTEHYGASSGALGTANSFFGYFSGTSATAPSYNNSYFGANSGRLTTSGFNNTAVGFSSLYTNSTGHWNTGTGAYSLYSNTTGHNNTAIGKNSMYANVGGYDNTATGSYALQANTSGYYNTAHGSSALYSNSTGISNSAFGAYALRSSQSGSDNVAIGDRALYSNVSTGEGVAIGSGALYSDTYGGSVAVGYRALYNANTALVGRNVAVGYLALFNTTSGGRNVAIGTQGLYANTTGNKNVAMGYLALGANTTGEGNTAFGDGASAINGTGSYNSGFGLGAGPISSALSNTTSLGNGARATISNEVRLGNSSVVKVEGPVNYSIGSDGRFKNDIKEDVGGLEFINLLRPVSYIFDLNAYDIFRGISEEVRAQMALTREEPIRQTGFIAQEVDQALKILGKDFSGVVRPKNEKDYYSIRYAEFVVPLVKAVQELNAKVEEQQQTINALLLKDDSSNAPSSNPQGAILYDTNPNPFSNDTEIKMKLPETIQQAKLIVYNLEGNQLKSFLVDSRGDASVKISSNDLPGAGIFLYALVVDGKAIDIKRMIIMK